MRSCALPGEVYYILVPLRVSSVSDEASSTVCPLLTQLSDLLVTMHAIGELRGRLRDEAIVGNPPINSAIPLRVHLFIVPMGNRTWNRVHRIQKTIDASSRLLNV